MYVLEYSKSGNKWTTAIFISVGEFFKNMEQNQQITKYICSRNIFIEKWA